MNKALTIVALCLTANMTTPGLAGHQAPASDTPQPESYMVTPTAEGDHMTSATLDSLNPRQRAIDEAVGILDREDLDLETRLETVKAIIERHPEEGEIWAVLGELRLTAGDDDEALLAFERALDKNKELYSSWHWVGVLKKRNQRDLEGALDAFRQAIEHGGTKAVELNEIGITQAQLGRMEEAYATWTAAIEADPDWGVLYSNALKAALRLKKSQEAESLFQRGLKAKRFEETMALIWTDNLVRQNDRKAAIKAYEEALDAAPESLRLRYYYGVTLAEAGEKHDAIVQLEKTAMNAKTNGEKVTQSAAEKYLFSLQNPEKMKKLVKAQQTITSVEGDGRSDRKKLAEAIDTMSPIIAEHPNLWEPRLMRGVAHRRLGHSDAARSDFEAVLTEVPDQSNALVNLALLFRDQKEFDRAADYAQKAADLAPNDPNVMINATLVMIDCGDCDEAKALASKAYDVLPEEAWGVLDDALAKKCQ